jgi:nitrite reductase/ring-hydroxylating ferredoxin subunit
MSGIKIRLFFLITAIMVITPSCEKEKNDVIPDVYVDFYVDLQSDIYFFDLASALGNSVYVSSQTNNWGIKSAGYDGNGIIIYHALPDEYYAYDRTCPHCFVTSSISQAVDIDGIYAVCPRCSTTYALPSFGVKSSGPGQYPLKNYRAVLSGQYLHVWNRY